MKSYQHLAMAEAELDNAAAYRREMEHDAARSSLLAGILHALISNAIEAGAFHHVEPPAGGSDGV